jgi:hypothetical protein
MVIVAGTPTTLTQTPIHHHTMISIHILQLEMIHVCTEIDSFVPCRVVYDEE